jgi:hypothetical protein
VDADSALQTRDAANANLESELAAMLGTAGYSQYSTYNHTTDAVAAVKQLNDQLGTLALSPDQSQRLQTTLASQDLSLNLDDMDLFRSKEALDGIYQTLVDRAHQDLQQASSFLTPEQMTAVGMIQSNLLQSIRNRITLGQQQVSTAKQNGH